MQRPLSRALEIIPSNQTDQKYIPPMAPLVAPFSNANISADDNVKL